MSEQGLSFLNETQKETHRENVELSQQQPAYQIYSMSTTATHPGSHKIIQNILNTGIPGLY